MWTEHLRMWRAGMGPRSRAPINGQFLAIALLIPLDRVRGTNSLLRYSYEVYTSTHT
jgi:hypothetical protein